ncbi:MAG: hypothetical protein WCN85_11095 [Burkholderiales bacterium]
MLRDLILAFDRFVASPSPVDLLALAALAIPILMAARVLRRAGFSRWWALLVLVPVVNLVGLWLFAYIRWPAVDSDR